MTRAAVCKEQEIRIKRELRVHVHPSIIDVGSVCSLLLFFGSAPSSDICSVYLLLGLFWFG